MKRSRPPPPPQPKVVSFALGTRALERRVHELARDSKNILWGRHARQRMEERGFVSDDALRILRSGYIKGAAEKTERDEWKVKMTCRIKGAREAGVVTIILHDERLFLKTIEWEDQR